jgi:hypothetical protein
MQQVLLEVVLAPCVGVAQPVFKLTSLPAEVVGMLAMMECFRMVVNMPYASPQASFLQCLSRCTYMLWCGACCALHQQLVDLCLSALQDKGKKPAVHHPTTM